MLFFSTSFSISKRIVFSFILSFLLLMPFLTHAQTPEKIRKMQDSLIIVGDSAYIVMCCSIADEYVNNKNLTKAINYIDSGLVRARLVKSGRLEGYVYNIEGTNGGIDKTPKLPENPPYKGNPSRIICV